MKKLKILLVACALAVCGVFSTIKAFSVAATTQSVRYVFSGAEANVAGYAEGRVEITPDRSSGYCHLFWANDDGILQDYEKITTEKFTSSNTFTYEMAENMAIPNRAKYLATFFSDGETPGTTALSEAELYEISEEKRFHSGKLEMNFASVSDVHVNYSGAPALWTQALNYFDELGLEMVVVSGDCTNDGTVAEYTTYVNSITASAYSEESIYVARGNHDSQQNENYITYTSRADMVRPNASSPWFYVLKEGDEGEKDNLFIFLAQELDSISASHSEDNFSTAQMDWFESVLEQFAGRNTNIFVVQHGFFHNWGPGDRYDGVYVQPMKINDAYTGNMRFQKLLMEYKEIVLMSGHSHIAYSEMVNYSDENGTACRMIHNSSTAQPRVYNEAGNAIVYGTGGSEGYVVEVYQKDIVYNGTNLLTKKKIPTACYIMSSYTENRGDATAVSVTKTPNKTFYDIGEYFDATGMEVTATYADGSQEIVQGWGLEQNFSLSAERKSVGIIYGNLKTSVSIKMGDSIDQLEGAGTYTNPYLISTPEDFIILTKAFTSIVGENSHDNNTFGKGMYFLQTKDIDLTNYTNYEGTDASAGKRYGFSGVYNGGGHGIKVNISTTTADTSIFPYVNGVIMNVHFEGRISAATQTQPIRTVGSNGSIINCSAKMELTGTTTNGLALSNYGRVIRYFSNSTLNGTNRNVYAHTNQNSTYMDCYYDGGVLDSNGTKVLNYNESTAYMNDMSKASVEDAVALLQTYSTQFTSNSLAKWENMIVKHTHIFDREELGDKYVATPATCQSVGMCYKHCACGQIGTETFISGEKDFSKHVSNEFIYIANHNGTHQKLYQCCSTLAASEPCQYGSDHICDECNYEKPINSSDNRDENNANSVSSGDSMISDSALDRKEEKNTSCSSQIGVAPFVLLVLLAVLTWERKTVRKKDK